MNATITIDNRQFERRQERQGKKDILFIPSYPRANYSYKRQQASTSYGYYYSPIDIDTNQKDSCPRKDKSSIIYYNYSKPGYFKRDYYSPKKDRQRLVPKNKVAIIDRNIQTIKVLAYDTYDQDNLKADIEYKSQYVRDDLEDSDDIPISQD